jgi:hypothetical protein
VDRAGRTVPQRAAGGFNAMKWMSEKSIIPRLVLGSVFVCSGLNGLFRLFPDENFSPQGQAFINTLRESGFWVAVKTVELIGGFLLIYGNLGILGVLMLAPICVGIVIFHAILSPQGAWLGYLAFALEIALIILWRKNFMEVLRHGFQDPEPITGERDPRGT